MSEKIANEALQRAQEISQAIIDAGDAQLDNKQATPEHASGLAAEGGSTVLLEDLTLTRADAAQWKHRYQVLKGKYDAEMPRLNEQLRVAQARITELEGDQQAANKSSLNEALATVREELGDKVADSLATLITEQHPATTQPNKPVSAAHAADAAPEEQASLAFEHVREMVDVATNRVGTFDAVNLDPAFMTYLTQTNHPQTGQTMQAFMEQKFISGELAEVARVFLSFVNMRTKSAQDDANLRKQGVAAPNINSGAANFNADEKPTYTRAEYDVTMKSLNHDKKYRTPEGIAIANKVRTELLEALRDGRIIG